MTDNVNKSELNRNRWSTRDVIYILLIVLGIVTSNLITRYDVRNDVMKDIAILFNEIKHFQEDIKEIKESISNLENHKEMLKQSKTLFEYKNP